MIQHAATIVDRPESAARDAEQTFRRPDVPKRIGVVLPNWIGDVVMSTPALRALRRRFATESDLIGVMNPNAAEVLGGTRFFDDVVLYQRRSSAPEFRLRNVARRLQRHGLDHLILLTNSFSSAILGCLSGARRRTGYARYGRRALLTTALAPRRSGWRLTPVSAVDYYLNLTSAIGCPNEPPRLELAVTADDRATADNLLRNLRLDDGRPLVALNNGGAYGGAKKWPTAHLIDLARRIAERTDANALIVCGPAERSEADRIERETGSGRVRSLASLEPSIGLTKACIARSDVVVSTDSGIRHFAAAFDVPCVTLFGPSDPRWSHNYHPRERILRLDLPCSPCGRRTCPLTHHRCLQDLSVSSVFDAVQERLDDAI